MKTLEIVKNCQNCIKRDACKYLEDYKALVTTNKFYGMFEYLEWNNLTEIFEANARSYKCYSPQFPNGKLDRKIHPGNILTQAFQREMHPYLSSWSSIPDKEGNVKYHLIGDKQEKSLNVDDLDWEVKIVNKLTPVL
jgi:hypothetical protein